MIEVKRSCNSSIRDDPEKQQINFNAFTIKITDQYYEVFQAFIDNCDLSPADGFEELILRALEHYKRNVLEPRFVYD